MCIVVKERRIDVFRSFNSVNWLSWVLIPTIQWKRTVRIDSHDVLPRLESHIMIRHQGERWRKRPFFSSMCKTELCVRRSTRSHWRALEDIHWWDDIVFYSPLLLHVDAPMHQHSFWSMRNALEEIFTPFHRVFPRQRFVNSSPVDQLHRSSIVDSSLPSSAARFATSHAHRHRVFTRRFSKDQIKRLWRRIFGKYGRTV